MRKLLSCAAVAALFAIVQVDASFAQSPPPADKAAVPAASEAPADKPAADKATPGKAAPEKSAENPAPKKPKAKKMTRRQEIDHSIDDGTVPARYRASVPKEYHQYIPFAK